MCYTNCPYENFLGECKGRRKLDKGKPHCFEEVTDVEFAERLEEAEEQKIDAYDYEKDYPSDG